MRLWFRSKFTRADGSRTRAIGAHAVLCLAASPAAAHGFGERYELPLPLSYYLIGAAAAIVVSFAVAGLFVRQPRAGGHPRVDLLARPIGRILAHPALVWSLKLAVLGLFVLVLVAGFIGSDNPYRNIAPTLVWIVGWVGLAYVSALLGDVWALANPWRTLFAAVERLYVNSRSGSLSLALPYPAALGVWPAFILLFAFSWIELVYPSPAVPLNIAWLVVAYSVVTLIGMALFGRETWLRHGEVFTVVFSTFARFAPVDLRPGPRPELALRPPGAGLRDASAVSNSMVAFVLLLLATVLYDGASTSPEWMRLEGALTAQLGTGEIAAMAIKTAGLLAFWLVFAGAYVGVSALMSLAVAGRLAPLAMARSFALTLVPIAIGYHVAHYLTYLLVQGQYVIPLASDPFGRGWDLLGTAGYRVDIAIVGARFTWVTAVGAVVAGHVAAVYLAHRQAMQVLGSRRDALASQVPLTALMVLYTLVSLTILAEPVVERRVAAEPWPAEIVIPAGAVRPDPSGSPQPVGAGRTARAKLTYRILGSAFHDTTRTSAADLLYAVMFAYRWGAGPSPDLLVAAASAPLRRELVALQVVGTDTASKSFRVGDVNFVRELFTVDVYVNAVPHEPEQGTVAPWSTVPWHVLVLMEEAVSRGWAAFSAVEAARRGVPWLDLVRSDAMKAKLAGLVATFERDGYRPETLAAQVSAEEARRRWAALAAFHRTHGHFLVTNGPYRLKGWSADHVTLEAFRDLTYPLGVGSYDAYAVPRRGFVTKVDWNAERALISGDVEVMQKFQRSYRLVRTPLQSLAPEVAKRMGAEARYTVVDDKARVVRAGTAKLADDLKFRIDLTGLPAGRYTLLAAIALAGNMMNAEISRTALTVAAKP